MNLLTCGNSSTLTMQSPLFNTFWNKIVFFFTFWTRGQSMHPMRNTTPFQRIYAGTMRNQKQGQSTRPIRKTTMFWKALRFDDWEQNAGTIHESNLEHLLFFKGTIPYRTCAQSTLTFFTWSQHTTYNIHATYWRTLQLLDWPCPESWVSEKKAASIIFKTAP